MRRDDHGIDHEQIIWWRQQGKLASRKSLKAALAIVTAKVDTQPVERTDGRGDDDSGD